MRFDRIVEARSLQRFTWAWLVTVLLSSTAGRAVPRVETIDLDGAMIHGTVRGPVGARIDVRSRAGFEPSIAERADFYDELRAAIAVDEAEDIDTAAGSRPTSLSVDVAPVAPDTQAELAGDRSAVAPETPVAVTERVAADPPAMAASSAESDTRQWRNMYFTAVGVALILLLALIAVSI